MFVLLQNGATPLLLAVYNGHLDVVRYLIKVGCEKEASDKVIINLLKMMNTEQNYMNRDFISLVFTCCILVTNEL